MNIIISGGGTGGHIYPALAIAEQLRGKLPEAKITFVGTEDGLENSILKNYPYELLYIDVCGFKRSLTFDTLRSAYKACLAFGQARQIVRKLKPSLVLGTGGYVCGPVVLAAALAGIKTCLHEQNAVPGITNKLLGKVVDRIYLGNGAAQKYFSAGKKIYTFGNPVRAEVLQADRESAYQVFGLSADKLTLLISGGSRGAMSINKAMLEVHEKLANSQEVQVIHVTGSFGYEEVLRQLSEKVKKAANIKVFSYLKEMPQALAITDLAIFRAGALGLAELAAKGIPSILVPYPYATANHQEQNAKSFEIEHAAIVVRDKELTGAGLYSLVNVLFKDSERLKSMGQAARSLSKPRAAEEIADNIISML